jgi:hypothetical protein
MRAGVGQRRCAPRLLWFWAAGVGYPVDLGTAYAGNRRRASGDGGVRLGRPPAPPESPAMT